MTPSLDYLGHIRPLSPSRHSPLFLLFPSNSLSSPPNYPTNVQLSVRRSSSSRSRSSATLMRVHGATRQSSKEKSGENDRRRSCVVFPCRFIVVLNSPWYSRSSYRRCIRPLDDQELPRCLLMRDTRTWFDFREAFYAERMEGWREAEVVDSMPWPKFCWCPGKSRDEKAGGTFR